LRPARPLRSLAPPGSPCCDDPCTWPGRDRPSVLSWDSHPPEFPPPRFRVRSLAQLHAGDSRSRCYVPLRASSRRGCIPRPGLRRLGSRTQDPPIRQVYRTRVSPSSGDPAHRAPLERSCAPATSPALALAGVWTERLARAPSRRHPAPPCPWRALPPKGSGPLDLEDARVEPSTTPTPRGVGWRPRSSRRAA